MEKKVHVPRRAPSALARIPFARLKPGPHLPKTSTPSRRLEIPMHQRRPVLQPPIPGTGLPVRGLFVSRASGLMERPHGGTFRRLADAQFAPRGLDLLFRAGQAGWNVYLVGNEDAVAHGRQSDSAWSAFDDSLQTHIHALGIPLKRSYTCLDHPAGKGPHRRDSVFRFPNTGCLYHAAQEDGIDLRESWMISGDVLELAAGWRAGLRVAAIGSVEGNRDGEIHVEAVVRVGSFGEALGGILVGVGSR